MTIQNDYQMTNITHENGYKIIKTNHKAPENVLHKVFLAFSWSVNGDVWLSRFGTILSK